MGREAGAINHGVGRPTAQTDRVWKWFSGPDFWAAGVGGWSGEGEEEEEVGGFAHSIFFKCSDTVHLRTPPVTENLNRDQRYLKTRKDLP